MIGQNIHVLPLILILFSETVIGQELKKANTANGTLTCSADTPSSIVSLGALPKGSSCVSPGAQCSLQCRQLPKCTSFNYKKKTRTCELFTFTPQACSFEYGCTFYYIPGQQSCPGTGLQRTTLPAIQTTTVKLPTTTTTTAESLTQADNTLMSDPTVGAEPQATTDSGTEATLASSLQATGFSSASETTVPPDPSVSFTTAAPSLVCSSNLSTSEIYLGQSVKLICTFNNVGMETTVMTWTDSKGKNVTNATTTTTGNQVISYILIPGYFPSVGSFQCDAQLSSSHYNNCSTSTITVVCPSGFDYLSSAGGCYKMILQSVDWDGARLACQQARDGAYSVMITSDIEQLAITTYLKESFNQSAASVCQSSTPSVNMVWTCGQLNKIGNCNSGTLWKPASGVTYPLNYTNWASGEPSCKMSSPVEANIAIYDNADCSWGDRQSIYYACAFCEYGPY